MGKHTYSKAKKGGQSSGEGRREGGKGSYFKADSRLGKDYTCSTGVLDRELDLSSLSGDTT
jgi:hypothetical protein